MLRTLWRERWTVFVMLAITSLLSAAVLNPHRNIREDCERKGGRLILRFPTATEGGDRARKAPASSSFFCDYPKAKPHG